MVASVRADGVLIFYHKAPAGVTIEVRRFHEIRGKKRWFTMTDGTNSLTRIRYYCKNIQCFHKILKSMIFQKLKVGKDLLALLTPQAEGRLRAKWRRQIQDKGLDAKTVLSLETPVTAACPPFRAEPAFGRGSFGGRGGVAAADRL
jgi:hypothetical protein